MKIYKRSFKDTHCSPGRDRELFFLGELLSLDIVELPSTTNGKGIKLGHEPGVILFIEASVPHSSLPANISNDNRVFFMCHPMCGRQLRVKTRSASNRNIDNFLGYLGSL